jgi:D-alanyl-D-alanine carboxypeptidase (penicillin-binding protein 5/6)
MLQSVLKACAASGLLLLALAVTPARAVDFATDATHVYIIDADTGAVLFDKAGEERIPTASMSKMMTAYVVFQQLKSGKLRMDDEFPVSEHAWRTGGSRMYLPLNASVKVEDLIQGMIVQSGNDACVTLAEGIAGSEDAFVKLMNDEAQVLGLKDSHFANSDGLPDDDHYMTPHDLALLGLHLINDFPEYYHYFSQIDYTYANIKQGNRNPLLYGNTGADGIKTGHTEEAGFSLTASVRRGDRHIIMVATGLKSLKGRSQEAERIVDFAFRSFDNYRLLKKGQELDQADVWVGAQRKLPLVAGGDLSVTLPRTARQGLKVTLDYQSPIKAPIASGTAVGTITVSAPDVPDRTVPLLAGADVARLGPLDRIGSALDYMIWRGKS